RRTLRIEFLESRELLSNDVTGNLLLSLRPGMPAALTETTQLAAADGVNIEPTTLANVFEVRGAGDQSAALMQLLAQKPYVNYVEPEQIVHADLTPNDP